MDYYEELGLSPRADTAEIHQAYRNLVRLLHPDQHAEPRLRRLAEAQMRRLNLVHETLTDPERRRRYDASLAEAAHREAQKRTRWRLLAAGAATVVVCLAIWVFPGRQRAGNPASPPAAVQEPPAAAPSVQPSGRSAGRSRGAVPRPRRTVSAFAAGDPVPVAVPDPPLAAPGLAPVSPVAPLAAAVVEPLVAREPEPPAPVSPFAGTWVYVPPRIAPREAQLYPPEYVEAVVQDAGGTVRGRYRARYRVADRPISPAVAFQFEGHAAQSPATLTWNGPAGAAGEVKLTLLPSGNLRVDWLATSLGGHMGLASGTAVLTRRQDP